MNAADESRPRNCRRRKTAGDIKYLKWAIHAVLKECQPMTVRQVFYQLLAGGAIDKTEAECRLNEA